MENLNLVPNTGTYGECVKQINDNFELLSLQMGKIERANIGNKGRYDSAEALVAAIPEPQQGWWAYVGVELPYAIYGVDENGDWEDTGETWDGGNAVVIQETVTPVQTTGQSTSAVMSQKAVTDALAETAAGVIEEIGGHVIIDGDVTNNPDYEDLTSVHVDDVDKLKFSDKVYSPANFSGYGRKYLRKNIVSMLYRDKQVLDIASIPDTEIPPETEGGQPTKVAANINDAVETIEELSTLIGARITHAYWNLNAGVGGKAILYDRDTTNESSAAGHWSVGYIVVPIEAGDTYSVTANFKSTTVNANAGYFWAIIDNTDDRNIIQCDETTSDDNVSITAEITAAQSGWLVINHVSYQNPPYSVTAYLAGAQQNFNVLTQSVVQGANTIYIVQYDYDLNYGYLELPENGVLWFQGGSIKRATIKGNRTTIIAGGDDVIFDKDTAIIGTWCNREWHPKWFGAYADGVHDDTQVLQHMLNLSTSISSHVDLILYNKTFRTTSILYLKSNTSIFGGTLSAKFDDPLQWVLQTYSLYNGTKVTGYKAFAGWQAFDAGIVQQTNGGVIKDLTIRGELNDNGDGTYAPIFGGLRIEASNIPTENVTIRGVGYGMCRAESLQSSDRNMNVQAYFTAYAAYCVNGVSVYDSYLNARSHYQKMSPTDTQQVIPYAVPYQGLIRVGGYSDGEGGVYDYDELARPKFCSVRGNLAIITFVNALVDYWCEVAVAVAYDNSNITFINPWWEAIAQCFIYTAISAKVTVINPQTVSDPTYDIYMGQDTQVSLIGGGITCSGYGVANATSHKFSYPRYTSAEVFVLDSHRSNYPDCDRFHFLDGSITYNIPDDSIVSNYNNPPDAYWSANNGSSVYKSLYYALMGSRTSFSVPAGTTASDSFSYQILPSNQNKIFSGSSKKESRLVFNNMRQLTFGNNSTCYFNKLTIEIYNNSAFKGNWSFIFNDCDIVITSSYNTLIGQDGVEMKFYNCRILAKSNVFGRGKYYLSGTTCSPSVRFGNIVGAELLYVKKGTTATKNANCWHYEKGFDFYDTDLGRKEYWNLRQWVLDDGFPYIPQTGTEAQLPSLPNMKLGSRYYDTTNSQWKTLTANGTCAHVDFSFADNIAFAESNTSFFVGTTQVDVENGAFTTSLPAGTYPISCHGYDCTPSSVTISDSDVSVSMYVRPSAYTTSRTVTVNVKDGNGNALTGLRIVGGGKVFIAASVAGRYTASLLSGSYTFVVEGYDDRIAFAVASSNLTLNITLETPSETATSYTVSGTQQTKNTIVNSNGDTIGTGSVTVNAGGTSLEIPITAADLELALYFSDYTLNDIKNNIAYLILKAWFAAGHYGTFSSVGKANLYLDNVGVVDGLSGTFTDNGTNILCSSVSTTNGTAAMWANDPVPND